MLICGRHVGTCRLRSALLCSNEPIVQRELSSELNNEREWPVSTLVWFVAGIIMTRARIVALALTLAMGTVSAAGLLSATTAQAAEPAGKVTTKAVAEPLKKAQEAMKNKQWYAALAGIKQAQASEKKTPFEAYQIDEFLGYVLIQQKKFGEAAPVFERMINSGFLPPEQVDDRTKTVAQLYFQVKDYKKSAE